MKKIKFFFLLLFSMSFLNSFEAGGGLSVFIPDSLFKYGDGSISFEKNFQFDLGLTEFVSIMTGLAYNSIYGLTVKSDTTLTVSGPWFYADAITPYAMLKIHIPIKMLYIDIFGGGTVNWNPVLRPIIGNIQKDLSSEGTVVSFPDPVFENNIGLGYLAGGEIGIKIEKIRIDISIIYKYIVSELNLSGLYYSTDTVSGITTPVQFGNYENLSLVMNGFSFGINGSLSF